MSTRRNQPLRASPTLSTILDRQSLQSLAGPRAFERGEEYFSAGRAEILSHDDDRLTARVCGTETYYVELQAEEGYLGFSCTCPVGTGPAGGEGAFCKHCVAAGLTWIAEREGSPVEQAEQLEQEAVDLDTVRSFLSRQEKSHLVDLLVERAVFDENLLRAVALEMTHEGGKKPGPAALRASRR